MAFFLDGWGSVEAAGSRISLAEGGFAPLWEIHFRRGKIFDLCQ